ncbi:MAG TPA: AAA domain-containing protein [Longimicrobiales bacterium]|nr:AAA domain-containing protein [Longimicrobiales bacterium]
MLLELTEKTRIYERRNELLAVLNPAAPGWASAVRDRFEPHNGQTIPGDAVAAWKYRQLHQEILRRAALDERELTHRLRQKREALRSTTARLIDTLAWSEQLKRTDLNAKQALQGWADTQKKIGKGTGKRAPSLQMEARRLLAEAKDAVPVWIMPLSRVAESFDPTSRFDVVIIDEASQSDVTGLLAWYLGRQVVVVGDHEQVSPMGVGQQIATITALTVQHLQEIPNKHLYDGATSIYDLARQSFGGTIALREHFRCVPDIIEFCNDLCYDFQIHPLRDPSRVPGPHVIEYVVPPALGIDRSGKTNKAEARIVAALIKAVTEAPEYESKTLGAITLLGDEQADLIQEMAVSLIGAVDLEARRFVAGNSAQFQGDERDVVMLSMVDVATSGQLNLRQTESLKQRYNVAVSRARDQLWLVHSLDPNRHLKPGDLRRRLIEYVRNPFTGRRVLELANQRAESPLEKAISERLKAAGYRVTPRVTVGRYRIDMVVTDGTKQVALECDGDRYHRLDQIPEDMTRQAVLERSGWTFIRVRGTRFYRDSDATMAWVFAELSRLGIEPIGSAPSPAAVEATARGFRDRVVLRAWEIMVEQGWTGAAAPSEPVASA